jgi:hypothetical protein
VCLNMSGHSSTGCLGKRPPNRRHCKGSCIEDYESDYGWTKVIDGQQHSVYIDQEGNERFHVSNLTHKAEFLETASANSIVMNVCTILLSFIFYSYNAL